MMLIDVEELAEDICILCGSRVCRPWDEPNEVTDSEAGEQLLLEEATS